MPDEPKVVAIRYVYRREFALFLVPNYPRLRIRFRLFYEFYVKTFLRKLIIRLDKSPRQSRDVLRL